MEVMQQRMDERRHDTNNHIAAIDECIDEMGLCVQMVEETMHYWLGL